MRRFDLRWPRRAIILTTLFLQLIFAGIVMAMGLHGFLSIYITVLPVPAACLTALSAFIHIVCYFKGSLHPLVVLTLGIEFIILWLCVVIFEAIFWARGDEKCGARNMPKKYWDLPHDRDGYESYSGYRDVFGVTKRMVCERYLVTLVFSVFELVTYMFLVTYAGIRRKRTAIKYVPKPKISSLSFPGAAYHPSTTPMAQVPQATAAASAPFLSPTTGTPLAPVQEQAAATTVGETATGEAPAAAPRGAAAV
ncbi:hypothetical protein EX30DRAFT_337779 [Ascodesmis nigricans]|uniref:Uncharacterized protein n=1 Tax=Ascodesmis nigricans TaxID=341454 RepID=A0A4S2N7R9_9PEZI|nr:hypothetical protein EX30DRAFT_337779 [Ascodesmis nigricans]